MSPCGTTNPDGLPNVQLNEFSNVLCSPIELHVPCVDKPHLNDIDCVLDTGVNECLVNNVQLNELSNTLCSTTEVLVSGGDIPPLNDIDCILDACVSECLVDMHVMPPAIVVVSQSEVNIHEQLTPVTAASV
jgi:hypothetical protein